MSAKGDNQRCTEYHQKLVPGFVQITRENITKRIKELRYIINKNITNRANADNMGNMKGNMNHNMVLFNIDDQQFINNAMLSIEPVIRDHTVVQLGSCKKIPESLNEYKKVARNRLNRNKPKFLGDFVFCPIIFELLYQFCGDHFGAEQMVVFVSMLDDILSPHAVVRFEQTRAQPLIPYNTFVMDNKFKNSCITLLRHFKLAKQWEIGSKKSNGKKETAKDIWHCFRSVCLPKLAERCRTFHNVTLPKTLTPKKGKFTTRVQTIPNTHTPKSNTPRSTTSRSTITNDYMMNNNNNNNNNQLPPPIDMTPIWHEQYEQKQNNINNINNQQMVNRNNNNNGLPMIYEPNNNEYDLQYNPPPNDINPNRSSLPYATASNYPSNNYPLQQQPNHNSNQFPPQIPICNTLFFPQIIPQTITNDNGNNNGNNNMNHNNYNINNNQNTNNNTYCVGSGGMEDIMMMNANRPSINNNDSTYTYHCNNNNDNTNHGQIVYNDMNQNHHQNNDINFQFQDESTNTNNLANNDNNIIYHEDGEVLHLQPMIDEDFTMNNMITSPMDPMYLNQFITSPFNQIPNQGQLSRATSGTTTTSGSTNNTCWTPNNLPTTDLTNDYNSNSNQSNFSNVSYSTYPTFNE